MTEVNALVEKHPEVDFVMIYIMEAHACDEWPIYQVEDVEQHKSLAARVEMAQKFQNDFPCHPRIRFFVDPITNDFNSHYASWPFRFWVLGSSPHDDRVCVRFKAMPSHSTYRVADLDEFLSASSP